MAFLDASLETMVVRQSRKPSFGHLSLHIILRQAISQECNAMSLSFVQHQKRLQKVMDTLLFDNMVKFNKHFIKK